MTKGTAEGLVVGLAFSYVYLPGFLWVTGDPPALVAVQSLYYVLLTAVAIAPAFESCADVRATFAGRRR